MTRQAYVDHEKKALLYWSPKAGCTSLVQWFAFGRLGRNRGDFAPYRDARAWLGGEGYLLEGTAARALASEKGYSSVVLARHPATRVLSAFLNKFVVYGGKGLENWEDLEPLARQELTRWGLAPAKGTAYKGLSFAEFLDHIEERVTAAAGAVPELDGHWNIQAHLNDPEAAAIYDRILCLEDFGVAVEWLNMTFETAYPAPLTNHTAYQEGSETADLSDVKSVELARSLEGLKRENFLTPAVLERIRDIYATDYAVFGYDPFDLDRPAPDATKVRQDVWAKRPASGQEDDLPPYDIYDRGFDKTVIAFGGLALEIGMPVFEFRKALEGLDCNFVFFRDIERSWYHAPVAGFGATFEDKGRNLRAILGTLADTELYLLGSSAGGFAALMFGAFLDARAALLFGPQVFIDAYTRNMLRDWRWPKLIERLVGRQYRSVAQVADRIAHPVNIIVGNKDTNDIAHALYAKNFVDARISCLTGGGHNPAWELKTAGVLSEVLADFIETGGVREYRGLAIGGRTAALRPLDRQ